MAVAAVPASALETVAACAPKGVEVRALPEQGADLRAELADVEFLVPAWDRDDIADVLGELPALEVVQTLSAGVDWLEGRVGGGVTVCSARGARDTPVAEWVVGVLLAWTLGLWRYAGDQAQRRWEPREVDELAGKRVLIDGMGSIGAAVHERLEALGCEVVGVGRRAHDGVRAASELPSLLPQADAVVVLTPLTEETRGLVDAEFLASMRDGALLVNAARGQVVVTDALLAELRSRRLWAALDVTDPEPLPSDHPLWGAPQLLLTPHVAGDSPQAQERAERFAGEQLARWAAGEELLNAGVEPSG